MMINWTSKLGGDEKWLDVLYVTLLHTLPFANNFIIGYEKNNNNNKVSNNLNNFDPGTQKERITIIESGKNEGGVVLNISSVVILEIQIGDTYWVSR